MKIHFLLIGIGALIFASVFPFYANFGYSYWLEISIIIGSIGIFLIIHGFLSSNKLKETVSLKIAWTSWSYKLLTLLSITFMLTLSFNFYAVSNSLNLASMDFEYQNEINNLTLLHKNEVDNLIQFYQNKIESLNLEITTIQNNDVALQIEISRLQAQIEEYKQQETKLLKQLRLTLVKVYGNLPSPGWGEWYESITFTHDQILHRVTITENSYLISLENWKTYNVTIVLKGFFGLITDSRKEILHLNADDVNYEQNWD